MMNADDADKKLSSLYQQRKQQITAPEPTFLVKPAPKPPRSWLAMLTLLLTGGLSSFAILAVISYFAKPPIHGENGILKQHSVRIVQLPETVKKADPVIVREKLPLKPTPTPPSPTQNITKPAAEAPLPAPKLAMNSADESTMQLLTLVQPPIAVKPVHRVMPKYPKKAIVERQAGKVQLSYKIAANGSVVAIELVEHTNENDSHRLLQRAAKQALAQWRYPSSSSNSQSDERLTVMFEFNLPQAAPTK